MPTHQPTEVNVSSPDARSGITVFNAWRHIAVKARTTIGALVVLASVWLIVAGASGAPTTVRSSAAKPTIVFEHGAFADASGFAGVTARLQKAGYTVLSPADPLRGPASDAAYLASILATIRGPVVLVGHSYGGEVISEAATQVHNVRALVFLNAFALDKGESALDITNRFTNDLLGSSLVTRSFPQAGGAVGTDLYIDPSKFRAVMAADVPASVTNVLATAQRPIAEAALEEKSTAPAWKTIPSWYLIGGKDRAIDPAAERFMAKRAKAHAIEIANAPHLSFLAYPGTVANLIEQAAEATG
jgi:pimeloyl-ACP methyl ester carboxylesterase